jgi:hypothetical protein
LPAEPRNITRNSLYFGVQDRGYRIYNAGKNSFFVIRLSLEDEDSFEIPKLYQVNMSAMIRSAVIWFDDREIDVQTDMMKLHQKH